MIILLKLFISTALAHCDQAAYDAIYRAATLDALQAPRMCIKINVVYKQRSGKTFTHEGCETNEYEIGEARNQVIRALRTLCFGQKSTMEKR